MLEARVQVYVRVCLTCLYIRLSVGLVIIHKRHDRHKYFSLFFVPVRKSFKGKSTTYCESFRRVNISPLFL
jgi:hypothetical protein